MLTLHSRFPENLTPAQRDVPKPGVSWMWTLPLESAFQGGGWKHRNVRLMRGPTARDVLGIACA